jgi:hypothetical protein
MKEVTGGVMHACFMSCTTVIDLSTGETFTSTSNVPDCTEQGTEACVDGTVGSCVCR